MKIQNKLKYVFGSIFVILIVLATNQIDQNNYTKINETSSSIYKDRLIASDILIQLSECFRNLEVSVIIGDSSRQVIDFSQFDKISTLFSKFEESALWPVYQSSYLKQPHRVVQSPRFHQIHGK